MSNDRPLALVSTLADVRALPESTLEICVDVLDDDVARALTRLTHLRVLRHLGNSRVTDVGIRVLATLPELEELDLEWSDRITDAALGSLATLPRLRFVDLSLCFGLTAAGLAGLQAACPHLHIEL